jgi:hypothetical protein
MILDSRWTLTRMLWWWWLAGLFGTRKLRFKMAVAINDANDAMLRDGDMGE